MSNVGVGIQNDLIPKSVNNLVKFGKKSNPPIINAKNVCFIKLILFLLMINIINKIMP